jgi:hypothetical protein
MPVSRSRVVHSAGLASVVAAAVVLGPQAMAQSQEGAQDAAKPQAAQAQDAQEAPAGAVKSTWTKRTSDGQPLLQGYWTNATVVPFERPVALGDKAFYTREEAAEFERKRLAPRETQEGTTADVHYQFSEYGLDRSAADLVDSLRTSLVVDPPNGRLPQPLPAAAKEARERAAYQKVHEFDSAKTLPLSERCILWPHEMPIVPTGYNSDLQILQSRGYVVIMTEMMPDARIVPLDGRPPLPSAVPQWLGDSRGHWEGDTLVIETTDFTGKTAIQGMPRGMLLSPDAHVEERFTRLGENRLRYSFTVKDPHNWARPWTVEYPMKKIDGPIFEYACQEGNYGLPNTLSGARAEERKAAEAAGKGKSTDKNDE